MMDLKTALIGAASAAALMAGAALSAAPLKAAPLAAGLHDVRVAQSTLVVAVRDVSRMRSYSRS